MEEKTAAMNARPPFPTGHLANGALFIGGRQRPPCEICDKAFLGTHNQKICTPCQSTDMYREMRREAVRVAQAKSYAKKKANKMRAHG